MFGEKRNGFAKVLCYDFMNFLTLSCSVLLSEFHRFSFSSHCNVPRGRFVRRALAFVCKLFLGNKIHFSKKKKKRTEKCVLSVF